MLEILEDSTQTLTFVPPVAGLPTAATVRMQTPSTSLPDSADSATIDSTSTTTNAAAEAGATSLAVADSTAWTAGTVFVLDAQGIAPFHVTAADTETGTTLRLASPLPCAIPSGATIKGCQVSHALTADETSDSGDAQAVWRVTIGGVAYQWPQSFRIVRRFSDYALRVDELVRLSPLVYVRRAGGDDNLTETIDAAWVRFLAPALKAKGVRLERIISRDELKPAHVAAVELLLTMQSSKDPAAVQMAREAFLQAVDLALAGNDTWVDDDEEEDAAKSDTPADLGQSRFSL